MENPTLVISNPPHEDIDPALAAPCFGLSPAEVRMKANYPIPEIWLADSAGGAIDPTVGILRTAGLNVVSVPGKKLAEIPAQASVKSFAFTQAGLTLNVEDSQVELSPDGALIAVFCQPRAGGDRPSGVGSNPLTEGLRQRKSGVFMARDSLVGFGGGRSSMASADDEEESESPFLDIYVGGGDDGPSMRLTVIQNEVDFSGLGDLEMARKSDNMVMFVAEFESKLTGARLDRRLQDMQPRARAMVSQRTAITGERKGFSFATAALSQLVESISPDLKGLSQFELASRLAYLTTQ